jgi:asparagine synthase (glutamine-hydrolysing)
MKPDDAQDELADLLSDAVRIRLRSDVPLGLSLSGGLDSSVIAWILRDRFDRGVEAYSAWFEPRQQSEIERAERTSQRYGHRLHPVPEPSSDAIADDLARCISPPRSSRT